MTPTHTLPAEQANSLVRDSGDRGATELTSEEALIPSHRLEKYQPMELSPPAARMPVELDVAIPVREFRIRSLLALEQEQVIATQWAQGEDIPLAAGDVQLAWTEFEVVETRLAVRLTRLT